MAIVSTPKKRAVLGPVKVPSLGIKRTNLIDSLRMLTKHRRRGKVKYK